MTKTTKQIRTYASSRLRFVWWAFNWRKLILEMVDAIDKTPTFDDLNQNIQVLEKKNHDQNQCILHLVRWIQTTHRLTPMPEEKTLKRLLFDAQTDPK